MFAAKSNTQVSKASPSIINNGRDSFIQPKLNMGKLGDRYEIEADKAADQIVAKGNEPTPFFSSKASVQKQSEEDIQQKPVVDGISSGIQLKEKPESPTVIPITTIQPMFAEDLQTKEEEDVQEKEEEDVQTLQKHSDGGEGNSTASIESTLNNSKGGGSPLDTNTKSEMESGFGTDFSNVRVHIDSNAVQMNQQLNSQAFTNGSDVYFNEGKYNPGSDSGRHLLAHELTHTVQQGASVQPKMIQKNGGDEAVIPETAVVDPPQGVTPLSEDNNEFIFSESGLVSNFNQREAKITLPILSLPRFKARNEARINNLRIRLQDVQKLEEAGQTVPTTQVDPINPQKQEWQNNIRGSVQRRAEDKINEARASGGFNRTENESDRTYFFKGIENQNLLIFGDESQFLERAEIPSWDSGGNPTNFQVDHVFETQLGGQNRVSNYELLEASANGSSGSKIMWELNRRAKRLYDVLAHPYYQDRVGTEKPNLPARPGLPQQYMNKFLGDLQFSFEFAEYEFNLSVSGNPERFWDFGQISRGEHLNKIRALTGTEVSAMGTEDDPALFASPTGGNRLPIPEDYPEDNWLNRVDLLQRPDFDAGTLLVHAYYSGGNTSNNMIGSENPVLELKLGRIPGTYGFYIDWENTPNKNSLIQSLRLPGMSPIRMDQIDLTENGFYGVGKVLPTVPLIGNADIDIVIDGDSIRMRKLFTAQEFDFPSPFSIEQASLEVSFGTDGLGIVGSVDFGINNVGTGFIGASASTGSGFELEGAFNFDSELFDPAEINVEYKDNIWTIGGEIGIPEGKVRGVKNATITATYSEGNFAATGEAELDIPGIQRGTMSVNYGDEGFSISGNFDLSDDIPGIQGGNVEARVSKAEGAENYDVFVSGTAIPDIPGISTSLTVTYHNGALTIEGSAAYSRGMLSGSIEVGATNRTIDEDGQPTGEPDDTMRVYGGGTLTLQLTPWLAATAGVKLLPNGEIEVTARLATDTYDVFARREFNRNLFTVPTIEIPLFAIPLGPRSLGLVAQIGGGLDFTAGFGPGQLRNLSAEITYNPEREEETTVTGHGEFGIPADAGLTLRGDLGLGLSVAIASLSGGIEIAGSLGLEGEALASVDVNWSPQTGIILDAEGRVTVNPKFIFDINAFARASLGIGFLSISETWRYNLASFSWGPDIQFGLVFPVHYQEDQPFDISFDDIEVIYPELDVVDMAVDLARDIKDDIF
ncbi:DUF4157 domain-containing protein [Mariniflexile sp.]|uniref:eCIS core domain-containing protein n=1 Tax=Mariniflexile sp. TaxID=1979402 RepID=UPI003561B358